MTTPRISQTKEPGKPRLLFLPFASFALANRIVRGDLNAVLLDAKTQY